MKRHDGDCSIYVSLDNNIPEAGICTCGYGHELVWHGDYSQIYSKELIEKLDRENPHPVSESEMAEILKNLGWGGE